VLELRQEVAGLRRENAELRQRVGYGKAMHARAVHRAEQLEAELRRNPSLRRLLDIAVRRVVRVVRAPATRGAMGSGVIGRVARRRVPEAERLNQSVTDKAKVSRAR
jgi:hypothetical protein